MADDTGNKKPKLKPKTMDVARPKKVMGESPQVIITPRPMMNRNISVTSPADDPAQPSITSEPAAASQPTTVKRPVIAPLNPIEVASTQQTPEPAEAEIEPQPPAQEPDKTEPASAAASDDTVVAATDTAPPQAKQPNAQTRKAVEEAERAAKRKEELESYVNSKKFFVPINAVARKRSIRVSSLLTVFVFLLALVLIDLMVDSGFIFLVQKIPHTHFFTSN